MSNYKLEVENTEKLKLDINSAFTEINAELKKDDDLVASDLFDIDKKIEELKKSRKRWACGENSKASNVSELNLNFEPSILICETVGGGDIVIDGKRKKRDHKCGTMIFEDFIYGYCQFSDIYSNAVNYEFFNKKNSNWNGDIFIKFKDRMYEDYSSINFWYAFE